MSPSLILSRPPACSTNSAPHAPPHAPCAGHGALTLTRHGGARRHSRLPALQARPALPGIAARPACRTARTAAQLSAAAQMCSRITRVSRDQIKVTDPTAHCRHASLPAQPHSCLQPHCHTAVCSRTATLPHYRTFLYRDPPYARAL